MLMTPVSANGWLYVINRNNEAILDVIIELATEAIKRDDYRVREYGRTVVQSALNCLPFTQQGFF